MTFGSLGKASATDHEILRLATTAIFPLNPNSKRWYALSLLMNSTSGVSRL